MPQHVTTDGIPRPEHPFPQFMRNTWMNLNGQWGFHFDDGNVGIAEKWYVGRSFSRQITVPFTSESKLSGIQDTSFHDVVWYKKTVQLPSEFQGRRILLHFGAVDYEASVWVNGQHAISHVGGHTPFQADITELLTAGDNVIVVRAQDLSRDLAQPRGKQYWEETSASIFYTRTTGIWQTVWIEAVSDCHLKRVKYHPDIDTDEIGMELYVHAPVGQQRDDLELEIEVRFEGSLVCRETTRTEAMSFTRRLSLSDFNVHSPGRTWSPNHPHLYDVVFRLRVGSEVVDEVTSYFGMRKVSVVDGKFYLNNYPYYMKLVLDQGYFPDGNLTPPSDNAIRQDIELAKQMGFNGARKHQKVEDPRFLYWCDKLGFLAWGEMANAYHYTDVYVKRITDEWQEAMERDFNHPSIVVWVPVNESWGVPRLLSDERQRAHLNSLYYLTKSLDPMRLVISNDGWEHTISDLCTIHDYEGRKEVLKNRYASRDSALSARPAGKLIYAPGYSDDGVPVLITEFGGIAFKRSEWEGWGYTGADSEEDFIARYTAVVHALLESPTIHGFCYTQLTDVEQEINGLLTYDRKPKVPLEVIKTINEGKLPK